MVETIIVFLIIALIITGILLNPLLTKRRRNRLKNRPFPPLWSAIVEIIFRFTPVFLLLNEDDFRDIFKSF
jgi:NADH:ubiquinone oxidoreductase subunit 3 (subunit A)